MARIFGSLILLVLSLNPAFGAEPFCTKKLTVDCDWPWVQALERLSTDASPDEIHDLARIAWMNGSVLSAAESVGMLARALHRKGHIREAHDLLDDAVPHLLSIYWDEIAYARVIVAEYAHALGDETAAEDLRGLRFDWHDEHTAYDRSRITLTLAKGLFDIGDRDGASQRFEDARRHAMKAPLTRPNGQYGDRVESLVLLWIATNRRDFRDITAKIEADLIPLIESQAAYRRDRGNWPLTSEDFRNGPPTGGSSQP
jgi:hypothetical protein